MKDHVKILLVGDEGVGKSSLISAYISQHFPQEVPPVMTDAIIPPETTAHDVCVTIMDSSSSQGDRDVLKHKIAAVDSIIALYDVTRPETFDSLSTFWLPYIQETSADQYKPVIVVGTKTDLLMEEQDTQQLNTLLLTFPFVMNCVNCSSVNIQNLDTVFFLAELFVNYPLSFILDVTEEEFTPAARRAFLRIFRIFDMDGDNLLCDAELSDTQLRCFDDLINTDELLALKRHISAKVPNGVQDNCVTFDGFVGLIRMNLEVHQYQIPWLILRRFNYDDNLNIVVPEEISRTPELHADQVPELSASARAFLLRLAQIAYCECEHPVRPESDGASEVEDALTWDALRLVLSVLSADSDDPWIEPPAYKTAWEHEEGVEQRILLKGLPHVGATLSFEDWISHWALFALNEPAATQVLLFKLGYVERADLGVVASSGSVLRVQEQAIAATTKPSFFGSLFLPAKVEAPAPRTTLQVCVLGDNGVGKSSFVWTLTGLRAPGLGGDVEMGVDYSKFSDSIVIGGCTVRQTSAAVSSSLDNVDSNRKALLRSIMTGSYEISVAAVPLDQAERWLERCVKSCDLIVLMFQCANPTSLSTALALEAKLPESAPRIFIASKSDNIPSAHALNAGSGTSSSQRVKTEYGNQTRSSRETTKNTHESVLQDISLHTKASNLPSVVLMSTLTGEGVTDAHHLIIDVATDPNRGIPRKQKKSKGNFMVSRPVIAVTTTVVVGIVSLSLLARYNKEVKDWLNQFYLNTKHLLLGSSTVTN